MHDDLRLAIADPSVGARPLVEHPGELTSRLIVDPTEPRRCLTGDPPRPRCDGAAASLPCSLALIVHQFPDPAAQARALSVWGGMSGIGLAAGPVPGGIAVDAVGWRAIFLVNVPVGLFAGWLTRTVVRETPARPLSDSAGRWAGQAVTPTRSAAWNVPVGRLRRACAAPRRPGRSGGRRRSPPGDRG